MATVLRGGRGSTLLSANSTPGLYDTHQCRLFTRPPPPGLRTNLRFVKKNGGRLAVVPTG